MKPRSSAVGRAGERNRHSREVARARRSRHPSLSVTAMTGDHATCVRARSSS